MLKAIPFIFTIYLLTACGSHTTEKAEEKTASSVAPNIPPAPVRELRDFPVGKIIPHITCRQDSSQAYSLYLPSKYSKASPLPLVYFFDPHARGGLPLNKYKALAEKYQFIFIGSENSQNGMSNEQLDKVVNTLMLDTKNSLAIDVQKIYAAGFSGGAKVAGTIALSKGGLQGVIGSGAGLPEPSGPIPSAFNYYAMVGDADFNYTEMQMLNKALEQSPIRHQLTVFHGKHEWPPLDKMDEAFEWMELQAMHDKLILQDDAVIKDFISRNEQQAKALEASGQPFEAAGIYNKLAYSLNGIHDIENWKSKANALAATAAYKKEAAAITIIDSNEVKERNELIKALGKQGPGWWKNEIQKLKHDAAVSRGEESAYHKRLLAFVSMACFMQIQGSLKNHMEDGAAHFLQIFQEADPQNSDVPYYTACLMAMKKNRPAALSALQQAIRMGFDDKSRLLNEESLASLKDDKTFQALAMEIK